MGRMTSKWCPQIFLADDDPIAHCSVKVLLIKETRLANDIVSLIRFVQGKKEQAKVHVVIPCFCTKSWLLCTYCWFTVQFFIVGAHFAPFSFCYFDFKWNRNPNWQGLDLVFQKMSRNLMHFGLCFVFCFIVI